MLSNFIRLLSGMAFAFPMAACNNGADSDSSGGTVASVTVTPGIATIYVGDTLQLTAKTHNADKALISRAIAWNNLSQTVAIINASGRLIALAPGDALLVASAGGFSDTAHVKVLDRAALCGNEPGNGQATTSGPLGPNPSGGDNDTVFRGFIVDLFNPLILFLGTERNGIVRSTDGGATWTRLRTGIRWNDAGYPEVWSLAQNPANPAEIFAATTDSPGPLAGDYPSANAGLYRSENSGQSWTRSNCGLTNAKMSFVLFVPGAPSTLVASAQAGAPSFTNPPAPYYTGGLFRSINGGANWVQASMPAAADSMEYWQILARGGQLITFAFRDADPMKNIGFLRSVNGGASWAPFAPAVRTKRYYTWVASASGDTLYAAQRDALTIDRSLDAGATWTPLQMDGPPGVVSLLAMSPADSRLVFYAGGSNVLLRSTDGFATREVVLTAPRMVQSVQFAPSDPGTVYAVLRGYSVYRSLDSGLTWSLRSHVRPEVLNVVP